MHTTKPHIFCSYTDKICLSQPASVKESTRTVSDGKEEWIPEGGVSMDCASSQPLDIQTQTPAVKNFTADFDN